MYRHRPDRQGHKPRGVGHDTRTADLRRRQSIREWLRLFYPDIPPPFGGDWIFAPSGFSCPHCDTKLEIVAITGVHIPGLTYCATCDQTMEVHQYRG